MTDTQIGGNIHIEDLDSKFYTFGLEWNEDALVWFIDDRIYHRVDKIDHLSLDGHLIRIIF